MCMGTAVCAFIDHEIRKVGKWNPCTWKAEGKAVKGGRKAASCAEQAQGRMGWGTRTIENKV